MPLPTHFKISRIIFSIFILFFTLGCKDDDPNFPGSTTGNNEQVGASANHLLASNQFQRLEIEVLHTSNYEPTDGAINHLKSFLESRLNKPNGITISKKLISSPGIASYTLDDVKSVEENNRSFYNETGILRASILICDGKYTNENVLGVAYRNTSIALFAGKIDEISGGPLQPSAQLLESTILDHEFGHLMGLVNVGTPLQSNHQDSPNGHHCNNNNCLMHFSVETSDVINNLVGQVPTLDAACIADLQGNGGK